MPRWIASLRYRRHEPTWIPCGHRGVPFAGNKERSQHQNGVRISKWTWHPIVFGVQVPMAQLGNELHAAVTKLEKSVWLLDRKLPFLPTVFGKSCARG